VTSYHLKPGTSWAETYARCVSVAPEAFEPDRILNLIGGDWARVGRPGDHVTPVDGSPIQGPPRVDRATAEQAVRDARQAHDDWSKVDLDERRERVTRAVDEMSQHRDLLAMLPSRVAKFFAAQGDVRSLDLPVPLPRFQVRLHWHERDELNVAGKWLRTAVADALRGI